ncbi:MAG: DUF58 domain-containing protein [Butyrivibrio sp.]|nr:DUF58 domain-containing protein [Butyrivibrio sp.]
MKVKIKSLILYIAVLALLCFMLWFNHRRAALFFIAAMAVYLVYALSMQIKSLVMPSLLISTEQTDIRAGTFAGLVCRVSSSGYYPFPRISASYKIRHLNGNDAHTLKTDYSVFHGSRDYRLDLKLDYCGVYELACEELLAYDFFGIFARRLECPKPVNIIVMPEDIEVGADMEALGLFEDRDAYSDPLAGNDVSEIKELRAYREGDRLSQVHWKLSGKSEELIVKEYEKQMGACVALVCGGLCGGLAQITEYYELLYSFAQRLLEEEIFFELEYFSIAVGGREKVRIDNSYSLKLAMEDMFFYHGENGAEALEYSDDRAGISRRLFLTADKSTADGQILAANKNAAVVLT